MSIDEGEDAFMKRIVVLLFNFCMLYFCMGCKMCDDKLCDNEKIHSVECIQLNSTRLTPEQFGEEKLETLLSYLYSTDKIISNQTIDESALLHDVVTIYYEDGERDMFCFHKIDDIWYMRQEDGTVIQDAAFISEYITHVENSGGISYVLSIPEEELLTALASDGKLDERYIFTRKLQERLSQGMDKTEAEKSARKAMISEYLLYQYALQNGYEVDDTSAELMEQLTELCKTAENLQELEKVGISLEEYLEMQENLLMYDAAKQVIYAEKYHAYRHGDTVIGEHDCSDFTEYWNTFLLEVVGIEMEGFDLTEYEKVLDEAAAFAWEYLG